MDVMFDSLVILIQSELQTQTIPPDDKKLCSFDHRKPKISPLAKAEGLNWRVNNRHYFMSVNRTDAAVLCYLEYVKIDIMYTIKSVLPLR